MHTYPSSGRDDLGSIVGFCGGWECLIVCIYRRSYCKHFQALGEWSLHGGHWPCFVQAGAVYLVWRMGHDIAVCFFFKKGEFLGPNVTCTNWCPNPMLWKPRVILMMPKEKTSMAPNCPLVYSPCLGLARVAQVYKHQNHVPSRPPTSDPHHREYIVSSAEVPSRPVG